MILHQQLPHPDATLDPWFALHCESLTIAICQPNDSRIHISLVNPTKPANEITNATTRADLNIIAADIRHHLPHYTTSISSLPNIQFPIAPYLLLNSLDGNTPAILHTQDPVALYLAEESGTLHPCQYFRSSIDLSVEGWAYWWEDAQRAFYKLTVEFMQATGAPVPPDIAAAVKHD